VVSQARAHEQQQHAHTHPAFHVSQGTLASLLLHPGHSLHRVLLREKPCVVRAVMTNSRRTSASAGLLRGTQVFR
jgi:hypothetical protein